jgi:hypothetical protein
VVSFIPQPLNTEGKNPSIHWIGGWMGPRAGLNVMEKRKMLAPLKNLTLVILPITSSLY